VKSERTLCFQQEILEAVLSVWPSSRVAVRLSPNGVFHDMGSPDFRETYLDVAGELNKLNLGYLQASLKPCFLMQI